MFVPRFSQNIFYTLSTHVFRIYEAKKRAPYQTFVKHFYLNSIIQLCVQCTQYPCVELGLVGIFQHFFFFEYKLPLMLTPISFGRF